MTPETLTPQPQRPSRPHHSNGAGKPFHEPVLSESFPHIRMTELAITRAQLAASMCEMSLSQYARVAIMERSEKDLGAHVARARALLERQGYAVIPPEDIDKI